MRELRHKITPPRRHAAVSLVELLVAVATVGLLVGLMVPTLSAGRRTAMRAACGSHLRQSILAAQMYLNDHNERFWPYFADVSGGRLWWFGFEAGGPHIGANNRPLDKARGVLAAYLTSVSEKFECPAFPYNDPQYFPKFDHHGATLGYNLHLGANTGQRKRSEYDGRASEVFVFADAVHFDQAATFNEGHYVQHSPNTAVMSGYAHFRHGGAAQAVMMDGHVESQRLTGSAHRTVAGWPAGNLVADDGSDAVYGK